jgi:capsid protein
MMAARPAATTAAAAIAGRPSAGGPADGSADADTLLDLPDLRARSRDLARNAPIATGAIATNVTNVVGDGLQLQASIDHEALGITPEQADAMEREQEREWDAVLRLLRFHAACSAWTSSRRWPIARALESGDCFVMRRYRKDPGDVYGTKLQLLEADRFRNPNRAADTDKISGGVESTPTACRSPITSPTSIPAACASRR